MDAIDFRLIEATQNGLPISARPYAEIGGILGLSEKEVIARLAQLRQRGLIKRLGVVVNHRHLGYRANAMVVIDVPDTLVDRVGDRVSRFSFVNLCYQRPRQGEMWPYNLYCMIHGKNRESVLQQLEQLIDGCELRRFAREVLFSKRCFKQRGAFYRPMVERDVEVADG